VVKALRAQRLAEARILVVVDLAAGQAHPVLANGGVAARLAAKRPAVGTAAAGVHRSRSSAR
jgi:hypothetical protein